MPAPSGKAPTPQRHVHEQLSPPEPIPDPWARFEPPVAIALLALAVLVAVCISIMDVDTVVSCAIAVDIELESAIELEAAIELGATIELLCIMEDPPVAVPFCCMAICLKSAWDFAAVGLMEKTMPCPQCVPVFCLQ